MRLIIRNQYNQSARNKRNDGIKQNFEQRMKWKIQRILDIKNVISEIKKLLNGINSQLGITERLNMNFEDLLEENFPNEAGNKYRNETESGSGESPNI